MLAERRSLHRRSTTNLSKQDHRYVSALRRLPKHPLRDLDLFHDKTPSALKQDDSKPGWLIYYLCNSEFKNLTPK